LPPLRTVSAFLHNRTNFPSHPTLHHVTHSDNPFLGNRAKLPHQTPYGHCITTSQLQQTMAGSSRFTAVAAGCRNSVRADNSLWVEGFTACRRNFESPPANIDWIPAENPGVTLHSVAQARIRINDGLDEDGSRWGYCSLLQLCALEKKALIAKYADAQIDSEQAVSKSSDNVSDSPIPPNAVEDSTDSDADDCPVSGTLCHENQPLNTNHFESVVKRFSRTSQPHTLASFAIISFMHKGEVVKSPYIQYLSNHRGPRLEKHLDRMESQMSFRPDRLATEQLQDWIYKARCNSDEAVTSCNIVSPSLFDAVSQDPACQKLAFTQGTYRGTFDTD